MRYRVNFVKCKKPSRNDSPPESPKKNVLMRRPKPKIVSRSMISFVERKNAINNMVNTETPEDFLDNGQKETFQYQVPRVRASFTLKVAPDSTTADLAESIVESTNVSSLEDKFTSNLPERDFRPRLPAQKNIQKPAKPILANRSAHNISNDDKDFEIPLEESLKAVEEFIKREKELSNWKVGEDVLAKWKGNGLYYKAKIMDIFSTGLVVVLFDSYDITEEMEYKDLCKFIKKTSNFKKKGRPQEKLTSNLENENRACARKEVALKKRRIQCKGFPFQFLKDYTS